MNNNPLPSLDNEIPLTENQVQEFRNNGHLHVRGLLSPRELAVYREAINEAAYRYNTETRELSERDITRSAGVNGAGRWCTGVSVVDINNDGWQDIYVSASFRKNSLQRTNLFYINQGLSKKRNSRIQGNGG